MPANEPSSICVPSSPGKPLPESDLQSLFERLVGAAAERVLPQLEPQVAQPRFVTKKKLADLLGLKTERTIKTWRAKGLPGRVVGREVMYDIDEVNRWIEAHS